MIWSFTAMGSQTLHSAISLIFLLLPSIPKFWFPGWECLARSSVMILTTSIPQLVAKVLGMTSRA